MEKKEVSFWGQPGRGLSPFPWLFSAYQVKKAKSQRLQYRGLCLLREGFVYRAGGRGQGDWGEARSKEGGGGKLQEAPYLPMFGSA